MLNDWTIPAELGLRLALVLLAMPIIGLLLYGAAAALAILAAFYRRGKA